MKQSLHSRTGWVLNLGVGLIDKCTKAAILWFCFVALAIPQFENKLLLFCYHSLRIFIMHLSSHTYPLRMSSFPTSFHTYTCTSGYNRATQIPSRRRKNLPCTCTVMALSVSTIPKLNRKSLAPSSALTPYSLPPPSSLLLYTKSDMVSCHSVSGMRLILVSQAYLAQA